MAFLRVAPLTSAVSRLLTLLAVTTCASAVGSLLGAGCAAPSEDVFVVDLARCGPGLGEVRAVEITIETGDGDSAKATYDIGGPLSGTLGARVPAGLETPFTVSAVALLPGGERVPLGSDTTDGSSSANPCNGDAGPADLGEGVGPQPDVDAGPDAEPDGPSADRGDAGDGCVPLVCEVGMCGSIDDGCGGTADCSACPSGQRCGDDNLCACTDAAKTLCGTSCALLSADSGHCGACDHTCRGGGCLAGQCQTVLVASGQVRPTAIAADADAVYWVNEGTADMADAQVVKMSAATVLPSKLEVVGPSLKGPVSLALGEAEAFTLVDGVVAGDRALARVSKTGEHAPELFPLAFQPSLLSAHQGFVYMAAYPGDVARLAWDTGAVGLTSAFAHYGMASLAAGDEGLFFTCYECTPLSLFVFDTQTTEGVSNGGSSDAIALSPERVYWSGFQGEIFYAPRTARDQPSGLVHAMPASGTTLTVRALAADDTHVYWLWVPDCCSSGLYRRRHDATTGPTEVEVVADELDEPQGLHVGPLGVFWTQPSRGEVHFLAR